MARRRFPVTEYTSVLLLLTWRRLRVRVPSRSLVSLLLYFYSTSALSFTCFSSTLLKLKHHTSDIFVIDNGSSGRWDSQNVPPRICGSLRHILTPHRSLTH
jgi:hypothetical protein